MSDKVRSASDLAALIDHTLLKPVAVSNEIETLCREAVRYRFASVCVNPCHIPSVSRWLEGTGVTSCCVVGFPLGSDPSEIKMREAAWCTEKGAEEIDMVLNIGFLKSGMINETEADIAAVVSGAGQAIVKVILECCYLTSEEIVLACRLAESAGARFVKTSTGFGPGGARPEDVRLMKTTVPNLLVKASGGIRDLKTALAMVDAGADRLGVSAGVAILAEWEGGHAVDSSGY
jgi:deoxyribose-phosphate aldolase